MEGSPLPPRLRHPRGLWGVHQLTKIHILRQFFGSSPSKSTLLSPKKHNGCYISSYLQFGSIWYVKYDQIMFQSRGHVDSLPSASTRTALAAGTAAFKSAEPSGRGKRIKPVNFESSKTISPLFQVTLHLPKFLRFWKVLVCFSTGRSLLHGKWGGQS